MPEQAHDTAGERAINALAVVKVYFDRDTSFLSYFEPFLEQGMRGAGEVVSIPELQSLIAKGFGLTLPQVVLKTLLRKQQARGHVVVESNTCKIRHEALGAADLEREQADAMRKQRALVDALIAYAAEKAPHPWNPERAQTLLLEYMEQFSGRLLGATMAGGQLPAIDKDWKCDQQIVHGFVLHAQARDPSSFEFLTVLVKGKMLADAVYLGESEIIEGIEPLDNLEVYLDTPILLPLLGYAGEEMAAPYVELLDMLKRQKAIVRCFDIHVEEARHILHRAERRARGEPSERALRDVSAYLARTATPSDIALKSRRLPSDLLRLGIQPIDMSALGRRASAGSELLARRLRRNAPSYNERALRTDVEAVAAVHQLRRGAAARSLQSAKAVFVTRNYSLYKASGEAFQQLDPGPGTPTCLPMSAFTTMVWVREPLSAPDLPRERIIAHAYAAMGSGEESVWKAVNRQREELRGSDGVSVEDAHHLRVHAESRHALSEEPEGEAEPYVEGSSEQVRRHGEEYAREEAQWIRRMSERFARCVGRLAARALFIVVLPLLCLGMAFGALGMLGEPPAFVPLWLQLAGTLCFGLLGALSLVDGISLSSRAQRTAVSFERATLRLTLAFMSKFTRKP